jgi:hypothetical protein
MLPALNFAVIENCTFRNVEGSVQPVWQAVLGLPHFGRYSIQTQYFVFCILHPYSHLSLFVFIYISGNKNHAGLFRPLWIFNLFPWPTGLRQDLKCRGVYFQTLLLYMLSCWDLILLPYFWYWPTEFFKLMNEVENEDLVFTLETIVDKFGEEMAPYALGLCQNLVLLPSFRIQQPDWASRIDMFCWLGGSFTCL